MVPAPLLVAPVLCLACAAVLNATPFDEVLADSFDPDGPGAVAAVLRGSSILWTGAVGLADLETGRTLTPDTPFDLASVSKQMTAVAIGLLQTRSALRVSDSVAALVPDFVEEPWGRPVTVEHLLHHTSGLADYTSDDWDGTDADFVQLTTAAHVDWLNRQPRRSRTGVRFYYNNSGYALLARIVEVRSGLSFPAFLHTNIFLPLAMTQSQAVNSELTDVPNRARGYNSESGRPVPSEEPTAICGDGNIFCSLNDLIRYETALRDGSLVSAAWLQRAFRSGRLNNGTLIGAPAAGYGYGWSVAPPGKKRRVFHSGSWAGTATFYDRRIAQDITILVLSNDESADVQRIAKQLAKRAKRLGAGAP